VTLIGEEAYGRRIKQGIKYTESEPARRGYGDKAAKAKGFKVVRNQLQNVVVTLNVSPEFVRRYKEYQAKEAKNHPKKK
jgi:hypothetical protein